MPAKYQYILKTPVETETEGVEKLAVSSLKTLPGRYDAEEIGVYGISPGSRYFKEDFPDEGVFISDGYA